MDSKCGCKFGCVRPNFNIYIEKIFGYVIFGDIVPKIPKGESWMESRHFPELSRESFPRKGKCWTI